MNKENISRINGYDIPCLYNMKGNEKMIVIISHGFGSSKESRTALLLVDELSKSGIGACSYDFPGHGESPVDGTYLRISNCIADLKAVENHVRDLAPQADIAYFSSSFGAYVNLNYLSLHHRVGKKSFLRSTAVDMTVLFNNILSDQQREQVEKLRYVVMDYKRPLKITQEFLADLASIDILKLHLPDYAKLMMIHGEADEAASVVNARRLSEQFSIPLIEVKGADHRFTGLGETEQVLASAIAFFTNHDN